MGKKVDTSYVVKLEDGNYQRWKMQVTLVLQASEVWDVVTGTTPRPGAPAGAGDPDLRPAWDLKDVHARAIIVPLLDAKNTSHISNRCNTAKEMWDKLSSLHDDSSNLNKQNTLTKFLTYRIRPEDSIVKAYTEIEDLSRSLGEMGIPVTEPMVVTKIVSSLPDDYQGFKQAWDIVDKP